MRQEEALPDKIHAEVIEGLEVGRIEPFAGYDVDGWHHLGGRMVTRLYR